MTTRTLIATAGALLTIGGGTAVAESGAAPPEGCGGPRSLCQKSPIDLRGFAGASLSLKAFYVARCVEDFRPEGTDLDPADLDLLWVRLERSAVKPTWPCLGDGGGGVRWLITWPEGPDGAPAGSVLIRQYLGRWKGEVSDRMTCDEAEGARCRVEGRDEVTLVREG